MFITEVPFKSNGESAQFFSDHLEFNGKSVLYDEIETLETRGATTVYTYFGIPMGRGFDGGLFLKMSDGKRHSIVMNAMSVFGIPIIRNPRKNEKLYPALFDAIFSIVAKNMAQKRIDAIRGGATVEVAGLNINSSEATTKSKSSKEPTVINKENYRDCQLTSGYGVAVYDKPGDILWSSSVWSNKNNLLIPYILDDIFS